MAERSVVITGVGAVSPLGTGADVLHRRWLAGELGLHDGEGTCRDFDPGSVLSTKEVRRADRFTQLALVAADEALRAAGWTARVPVEADRVSCVIGTGIGGLGTLEAQHDVLRTQGARRLSPLAIPLLMANAAAAAIARRHDLHGPALAPVAACASGANAIGDGARLIRAGAVDAAVVGGAEATLTEFARAAFAEMGASSPSGACRPFDARRDGFVMGEGAGVLVLERREAALARGAPVLGSVDGYWCTVDGYHLSAPEPESSVIPVRNLR
jgi:3-oxoacyl-[acyl-carrier-protein] synthase II